MIKVGLLQPGLFIFRRWENFPIVKFIVCWSGSESPLSLGASVQGTVQPSGSYATVPAKLDAAVCCWKSK